MTYFRIAELIAPGLVSPAVLRVIPLAHLSQVVQEPKSRTWLRANARVLADGGVRTALTLAPPKDLNRVNLTDVREGSTVWRWESELVRAAKVSSNQQRIVAHYVSLLIVDYLLNNLMRQSVLFDEKPGRLLVNNENDTFSTQGVEGAVSDTYQRLTRYLTYPRSTIERLKQLEAETINGALLAKPAISWVTPKQIEEILSRKESVEKLVARRIKLRGEGKALALP